mmetsp:Transcript_126841/g.219630  ORF Transcript_126841/g.219630 Transcript_126841/m.219630 type:complete len:118 (-) Transcript_126841:734-1087(-)
MMGSGACTPSNSLQPRTLRVMETHTLSIISHEGSPSQNELVDCWLGVGWVGCGSDVGQLVGWTVWAHPRSLCRYGTATPFCNLCTLVAGVGFTVHEAPLWGTCTASSLKSNGGGVPQ